MRRDRKNRYLQDRMDGRRGRRDYSMSDRKPRSIRDYGDYGDTYSGYHGNGGYRMDYGNDYRHDRRDYTSDYRRDYRDYADYNDYNDYADEWEDELKKWSKKLKKYDKFNIPKEELLKLAEQMKVEFEDYSEEEFIATYYMLLSDFPNIGNQPQTYLAMSKQWLEDEDAEMQGCEKLCAYYYTIVKGE